MPAFLIRAFEQQVSEANVDATDDDRVTVDHFIELHLAEQLSIADSFTAAFTKWVFEATYQPPE